MRYRDFDEDDVPMRPSRRGSRPRTKRRPQYSDAVPGMVTAIDRGRITVLLEPDKGRDDDRGGGSRGDRSGNDGDSEVIRREVVAIKARTLGRKALVVGDDVSVVGDISGRPDTLARIVRISKRSTTLRRTADDDDAYEHVIVANADQLVIETALADPEPRQRMVDRCLVAAFDAGMDALLCLTKADLAPAEEFVAPYEALNVPYVTTSLAEDGSINGVDAVLEHLRGKVSALVGHSGVGKSTLVNALSPSAEREIGSVNITTGRGRHTSTSAVAFPLNEDAGWVIDTPGIRSFGLAHIDPDRIISAFTDLAPATTMCPRGCTHDADAPGCALDGWVAEGNAGAHGQPRLDSLRRVLASRSETDY